MPNLARSVGGNLLRSAGGNLVRKADCVDPCCDEPVIGIDCPTYCDPDTTPPAFDLTFSGIADGTCTSSAYYNSTTFRFEQVVGFPCTFRTATTLLGGPCGGLGACDITLQAGFIVFSLGNPTPMVMKVAHTDGDSCQGPFTLPFFSQAGGPPPVLNFSGASATITPTA